MAVAESAGGLQPRGGSRFENDSSLLRFKAVEFGNQLGHVFGTPNEREGDHISVLGSKFKVFAILGRQGRNIELRIRQVNTLLGTKFGRAIGGLGNLYFEPGFAAFFLRRTNDALNLAIVKENSLTGLRVREDCRK